MAEKNQRVCAMTPAGDIPPPQVTPRREFLRRCWPAGVALAGTGLLARTLWNRHPPGQANVASTATGSLDFSLTGGGPKLAIVTGADRAATLRRALAALGGIGRFIRPGDRVVVKVNAAFASPAILGATTHPVLAAELVRLCREAGAAAVIVTDNPINDPESCFTLSGIGPAIRAAGGDLVLPRNSDFAPRTLAGGQLLQRWPVLHTPFRGATKLIGVAPVKHHARAGASMTLKNWYGLLGGRRNQFHQDVNGIIVELALLVRPTFVVLDGTTTMMANGPTGGSVADLKSTHSLIVSTDGVAADAFGATLLGRTAADLPYLGRAAARGAGTADFASLNPIRASV
jgi:uncharacterized protein (DUF362 family)